MVFFRLIRFTENVSVHSLNKLDHLYKSVYKNNNNKKNHDGRKMKTTGAVKDNTRRSLI